MNLKKIEVYGFKAFADKVEIEFDSNITAVVGPNGCGKSNVADTVRWVLGEQAASRLRGKTMQDLIFNGTEQRKSMSYCEASLIFDNSKRIFPLEYDEIVISRKLYRSGDSEYLLNRAPARLKDIKELLRNVGLGLEGYSIVGQGRMDAILNSKPDDRRAIFEEALGISNFRQKKKETENKLARNKDNMLRLFDITSELERQLGPLKKQAESAKKYFEISDQIRYNEVNSYIYNYDNAAKFKATINEKLKGINEELAFVGQKFEDAFDKYEECGILRDQLEAEREKLLSKETELKIAIERQSGEKNIGLSKVQGLINQNNILSTQIDNANQQIDELSQKIENASKAKADMQQQYELLTSNFNQLNLEMASVLEGISNIQSQNDQNQNEVWEILNTLAESRTQDASIRVELDNLVSRVSQIEVEVAGINSKIVSYLQNKQAQQSEVDNLAKEQEDLSNELQKVQKTRTDCDFKLFELNRKFAKISEGIATDNVRLKMSKDIAENYDSFSGGVKVLLRDSKENKTVSSKIVGVVANMIKVPQEYEVAIEVTLGGALQNIVTKNEDDAKALISYLKENRGGRVTFLPKTSIKARELDDERILSDKGVFGTALQLVGYDKEYHNVFSALLGSTVVVDNLENAVALSKKYNYKYRIVTLEGDMIVPQGSISGGSRKQNNANVLSLEREIAELQEKISQKEQEQIKLQNLIDQLTNAKQDLTAKIDRINDKKLSAQVNFATAKEKLAKTAEFVDIEQANLQKLGQEQTQAQTRISQIKTALEMTAKDIKELSGKKTSAETSVSEGQGEYTVLKAKQDSLSEKITEVKVKLSTLFANIENAEKEVDSSTTLLKQNQVVAEINSKQILQNKQEIASLEAGMQQIEMQDVAFVELQNVQKRLSQNEQDKVRVKEEFEQADRDKSEYSARENELNQKRQREEFNIESIDTNLANLTATVWEDYGLTYSNALQFKDENYDPTDSNKVISKLKNQRANLGTINGNAIEDYDETFTRYSEIQTQLEDLKKAESDLNVVIKDLTKEMVAKFNAGFETINKNFSYTFKELFKGGNARLVIEPNPDKEEIDYGIEIEAQPPGKKLQNISSYSGGERTLIVCAILFAIIKSNPMPFCLLDEIEAPLDDSNADRVARFLRKFSESTQFIVITHKKPTMESADVLYGVTMEEKGVSKIVSVKLTEAIKHAQSE